MRQDKMRDLARSAGISDDDFDRLTNTMDYVQDVLDGRAEPPGGLGCRFPHCSCKSPMEKCDKNDPATMVQ